MASRPLVAVQPGLQKEYLAAIALGGGVAADLSSSTTGLVWTDSQAPEKLLSLLKSHPGVEWVQLPFAGVDNFALVFEWAVENGLEIRFTSAKGAYREPVAEHALMLALALARAIPERLEAKSWGRKFAATLYDANAVIIGGGGITEELIRLLRPFRTKITVVRRTPMAIDGADEITTLSDLNRVLPDADFVFLASALTPETRGLFDAQRFLLMKETSYFINIARGPIVVSEDLASALRSKTIAGAGIDVTDPEPLPDGHYLWDAPNLIITPHSADTPEMCVSLLASRIAQNVEAKIENNPLVGLVDLKLGY